MNGRYRDIDKLRQNLTLNTLSFLQACFIIILCYNSSLRGINVNNGFGLRKWHQLGNRISYIPLQLAILEKDSHILGPCMIASRTIRDNCDRTNNVWFVLLSHHEENDHKEEFKDLKRRNRAQKWNLCKKLSKIGHVENF